MRRYAIASVRMALVTLVLLGGVYPFAVTGAAQALFPGRANGSLMTAGGRTVGSSLIGQRFEKTGYFHGRPSAAGENGYDAGASGPSNLAPTSRALLDRVEHDVRSEVAANASLAGGRVPVDMVTASGSGLDPDITVANALAQVPRVALARGMTEAELRGIVAKRITRRQFGVLGEERVNVLALNLALDVRDGRP